MSEDQTSNFSVNQKLDLLLNEVRTLNERVAALEAKSYDTRPLQERILAEVLEIKRRLDSFEQRLDNVEQRLTTEFQEMVQADVRDVDARLFALETKMEQPPA